MIKKILIAKIIGVIGAALIWLFLEFWLLPPVSAQLTVDNKPDNIEPLGSGWEWIACSGNEAGDQSVAPWEPPIPLRDNFPFDLIYPVNPQDLTIDSECMLTNLWGIERELCAPMMIARTAKDIFLLKVLLQSVLNL